MPNDGGSSSVPLRQTTTARVTTPPTNAGQWLEVRRLNNASKDLRVKIDLTKRIMELSVTRLTKSTSQFELATALTI
jgi:hypothetical protein